jgi:NitT/TauT family transport system permease protein
MNLDIVWATITVAAVAGSVSFALIATIERIVTFWHPSLRRAGRA